MRGGRTVRDREIKKYKAILAASNISGKVDSAGGTGIQHCLAGGLAFRRDSETTFLLQASTFCSLGIRQRAREEQANGGSRAVILLSGAGALRGRMPML